MPVTHGVTGSSPVRTAKANNKLKKNPEIQKFRDFFVLTNVMFNVFAYKFLDNLSCIFIFNKYL